MTNPLEPDEKPEKKETTADSEPSTPGISYNELMPEQAGHLSAGHAQEAQHTREKQEEADQDLAVDSGSIAYAPFTYYMGQKPQFQSRRSDFLHARTDKPSRELRPLVDQFLQETPHKEEHTLTESDLLELERIRESLSKFASPEDALQTALQLAQLYQHLRCVEEAKKATDLSLGIDPDNSVGKELFKQLEHQRTVDIAPAVLPAQKEHGLSKSLLAKRIKRLTGGAVIVLGDLIVDEFLEGKPERISREAPVLILEHVMTEFALGGAGNAAANVASLGGNCRAIGICGADYHAEKLSELLDRAGIAQGLVQDASRPTTVKTRVLSRSHSFKQQLLRLDRMSHEPVSQAVEKMLIDRLTQYAGQYSAIILSDYRSGVISDSIVNACRNLAGRNNLLLIADAQDRLERFQQVTALTPNEPDAERAVGFTIDSDATLKRAGQKLLELTAAKALLITRGAQGMTLFQTGQEPVTLPPFNKSEIFDVTGAGDTVVATMTLALVTGASFIEAMALGNLAAGIVVKKPGTAVTNQNEMLQALESIAMQD